MASRRRRKSVGVVEMARDLGVSTTTAFVGFVIPYVDTPAYSAVAAECARLMSAAGTQMIAGLVISSSTHVLDDTEIAIRQVEPTRENGRDAARRPCRRSCSRTAWPR